MINSHILITGAGSGIGLGILDSCYARGWTVTAVMRRSDETLKARFPKAHFEHFDVLDREAVRRYFEAASLENRLPDVYFLSAGTNKVDNEDGIFSLDNMRDVFDANFWGVFHFIHHGLPLLLGRNAMFVAASSMANIFPNPNCLGYFLSKLALHESFKILDRRHRSRGIRFKSMVLGPIRTPIFLKNPASGFPGKLRDFMAVSVEDSVNPILRFIESGAQALYYPKFSCLFFWLLSVANTVVPIYRAPGPLK